MNKGTLENPVWEAEAAEFSDNIDTYLQNQIDFEERMKEMQEIGMAAQSSKHLNIGGLFIKPKQAEQARNTGRSERCALYHLYKCKSCNCKSNKWRQ